MSEKISFDKSFGIFTPKMWYQNVFGSLAMTTAAKDEEEELDFLEYEYFQSCKETEIAYSDLVPFGAYKETDNESSTDGGGDYGEEPGSSEGDIDEVDAEIEEELEEDDDELNGNIPNVSVEYIIVDEEENEYVEDDSEEEEIEQSFGEDRSTLGVGVTTEASPYLNERITDSFLMSLTLDESLSSS